jgi:hypothetical protein
MRVASPCAASWGAMEGDGRVRFCRLCSLNDDSGKTTFRGKMLTDLSLLPEWK